MKMRAPVVAVVVGMAVLLPAGQANAASPHLKTGSSSVGAVTLRTHGNTTAQPSIAPCTAPGTGSTPGVTPVTGVEYGAANTSCTVNSSTGEATATVTGKRFRMSLLRDRGGPQIALTSYSTQCRTNGNGSAASISLSGLTGIKVPSNIPANYTVTVPGAQSNDPPLARVVVNELITPTPPDGTLTVNLMHITLSPQSAPGSDGTGEIVLGTVHCDPT